MLPAINQDFTYSQPFKRLLLLFRSKQFLGLTFLGNAFIFALSIVFYFIEKEDNYLITSWLDSLWWAFATVTTVGYGDIVPMTNLGKIIGMFSMLIGTGLFATYTALFANALLGREFLKMDRKMRVIKKNVEGLKEDMSEEEDELLVVIDNLKEQIEHLERKINRK